MSVCYDLFLEGEVDGRWVCLDGFVKAPDGRLVHRPVMSGQSVVGEMLEEAGCSPLDPEDLSPEVRERFDGFGGSSFGPGCLAFDPENARVPAGRYEYERYVPREAMNAYENGDPDAIVHWLTEAEYAALDGDEKLMYSFFRWDDPWGTFSLKRRLTERVDEAVRFYDREVLSGGSGRIGAVRIVAMVS